MLPEILTAHLSCPESGASLILFPAGAAGTEAFLFCPESRLKYRIDDGVPVMLIAEADRVSEEQATELLQLARAEDLRRTAAGNGGGAAL